ncbi:MAG: transposase [Bdellovibrionota bacterium]
MRSEKAKGRFNFRNHQVSISKVIETAARRADIKLHKVANVGNHLHLLVSFKTRESCQRFLREISGLIARKVTGAKKGKPFGKFWDLLAHSRVVTGFRGFQAALNYVFLNQVEGQFGTKARKILKDAKVSEREFIIAHSGA